MWSDSSDEQLLQSCREIERDQATVHQSQEEGAFHLDHEENAHVPKLDRYEIDNILEDVCHPVNEAKDCVPES